MILPGTILRRAVLLPLREQWLPTVDEIRHDLRGYGDGETFEVAAHLPPMLRLATRRAPARPQAQAPVSTVDATRPLESRRELREAR